MKPIGKVLIFSLKSSTLLKILKQLEIWTVGCHPLGMSKKLRQLNFMSMKIAYGDT